MSNVTIWLTKKTLQSVEEAKTTLFPLDKMLWRLHQRHQGLDMLELLLKMSATIPPSGNIAFVFACYSIVNQ